MLDDWSVMERALRNRWKLLQFGNSRSGQVNSGVTISFGDEDNGLIVCVDELSIKIDGSAVSKAVLVGIREFGVV